MDWILITVVAIAVVAGLGLAMLRRARPSWDQTDAMRALRRMSTDGEDGDGRSQEDR